MGYFYLPHRIDCLAVMFVNRIEFNISMHLERFGNLADVCRVSA